MLNLLEKKKTIMLSRSIIFTALSIACSFIKVPSPIGTIALDSFPGYFSSLAFGYMEGAAVISLGHIATSANSGFPLGFLHILIALFMILPSLLLRASYVLFPVKSCGLNLVVGVIAAATLNGLGGFVFSPFLGMGFALTLTPYLMAASYLNVILASAIFKVAKRGGSYES